MVFLQELFLRITTAEGLLEEFQELIFRKNSWSSQDI
jgi:hypothetical protein